jgi:hypothetical protein
MLAELASDIHSTFKAGAYWVGFVGLIADTRSLIFCTPAALLFLNSGRRVLGALQILLWTSFGLAVAAVVQAILGQLTFLEALQTSNLIWSESCSFSNSII